MAAPITRRARWLVAVGLVGAALAPPVAPLRRAAIERLLRLRAMLGDPVAPFLDAPCHQEPPQDGHTHKVITETAERPA